MSRKLTFNVIHLLRGAARQESLERLKREGHRSVSVLRSSDIEALLATAVDDTLAALGVELKEDTIRGLNEDARLRFLRLIKERDDLKATLDALKQQGDQLALQSGTLRHELQRTETELNQEKVAPPTAPAAELLELRAQLTAQLSAMLAGKGVGPELVQQTIALVEAAIENYRVLVAARVRREQEARITQLQRRIEKLRHKLEESDALLVRAQAARAEGVPFLTDIGPPLQPGDPGYAQKRELLEEIFKLNVELQRIIASTADTQKDPAARPETAATGAPPTA